jgi:N-acetylmuramic acid 6-phosphate etherase
VQATGVPYQQAGELLEQAGGSVRTAIVMAKAGLGREQAEQRLAAAGGRVKEAIGCQPSALS